MHQPMAFERSREAVITTVGISAVSSAAGSADWILAASGAGVTSDGPHADINAATAAAQSAFA
jgi:hypothetical protein